MQNILVTGGRGYIGCHVVQSLLNSGKNVRILDDMSSALPIEVPLGVDFIQTSTSDLDGLVSALNGIDSVIHLAAKKSVDESIINPNKYFKENSLATWNLLHAMKIQGTKKIVFSSTAAVYDPLTSDNVDELSPVNPSSPYGASKIFCENLIENFCQFYGFSGIVLRYFNVVGANANELRDVNGTGLFPSLALNLATNGRPVIFGKDYETKDGTAIRDFIHVSDLAEAHISALNAFGSTSNFQVFNVGTNIGHSVLEVVNLFAEVGGKNFDIDFQPRRLGDIPVSVSNSHKIRAELGWSQKFSLREMVESSIAK
jgi:UDP-glucose 4-epimerase